MVQLGGGEGGVKVVRAHCTQKKQMPLFKVLTLIMFSQKQCICVKNKFIQKIKKSVKNRDQKIIGPQK